MAQRELKVVIVGDASQLDAALGKATASAQGFGGKLKSIGSDLTSAGKKLTLGVTVPLVAAGAASFKMAEDFQTSMSRVIGLAGQSQKQVEQWSKQLLVLGPQLGKGPRELAEALYFVASSGISTSKVMNTLTVAAKASAAGLGETQQVADALTSVMNAYGESNMSAAHAADVLIATVREGKGEASDFAPIIGNVVAIAAKLKVSFEEVGGALASMTQLGTDAATSATQLQAFFSMLLKTGSKAEKAMQGVGTSSSDLVDILQKKGLVATLDEIQKKFKGNTEAMATAFPNIRALRALFGLLDIEGTRVKDTFAAVGDSTGSLAKAFEVSTQRTGFTMEKFKASIEAAGIAIGTILAPVVAQIATWLTKLSIAFQNLDPQTQKLVIGLAALAAVMGPVLIVTGSLVGAIGTLLPVFIALASPIGIVVVALAALGVALAAAVLWPDKLSQGLQRLGLSAKNSERVVKDLRQIFDDLAQTFRALQAVVATVWPSIRGVVVAALRVIAAEFKLIGDLIHGRWGKLWGDLKAIVSAAIGLMLALIRGWASTVGAAALAAGTAIVRGVGRGLAALPGLVGRELAKIPGIIARAAVQAASMAAALGSAIVSGIASGIYGAGKAAVEAAVSWLLSLIPKWARKLLDISSPSKVMAEEVGKPIAEGVAKGIGDNVQKVADKVRELVQKATDAVKSARGDFTSAFSSLASAALAAFDSAVSQWKPLAQIKLDKMQLADQRKQIKDAVKDANQAIVDAQQEGRDNILKAQQDLAKAIAGGDPEEIRNAQAAVLQAQRDATQGLLDAQQQRADALRAQQEFNLQQQAAAQQAAHDKQAARERIQLEQDLAQLQAQLAKHPEQYKRIHAQILAELSEHGKKLGVDQKYWGTVAGIEMAHGIDQAIQLVVAACKRLARAIEKVLKLKRKGSWDTEEGPMSDFGHWWDMFGPALVEGIAKGEAGVRTAAKGVGLAASAGLSEGLQTAYAGQIIKNLISPEDVSSAVGLGQNLASGVGSALATTAKSKDDLAKNFQSFTSQAQGWSDTTVAQVSSVATAFQHVHDIATTVWQAALASLKANIKEFQDPTARIAAMFQHIADAIGLIGSQAYATRNALRDTVADITNLLKQLQSGGGNLQLPHLAGGGALRAGQAAVVGEHGREVFIPSTSGLIVPSRNGGSRVSATGAIVNLNFYGPTVGTSREFEDTVRRAMYDVNRRNPGLGFALG